MVRALEITTEWRDGHLQALWHDSDWPRLFGRSIKSIHEEIIFIMKKGQKVMTKYGPGIVVSRERDVGILSHRYLVRLTDPHVSKALMEIQKAQGGLAFLDTELGEEE